MITDSQAEAACDYIRDHAKDYGQAKAARVQLMEFRKSKKALLMNEKTGPAHERESYAYAHNEYIALLDAIKDAVEAEESIRWRMEAARIKTELWRSQSANNRATDQAHR